MLGPGAIPDCGEAIRFGIEAGDSGVGTLGSISIPIHREERLDHVPIARKLCQQLLTDAGSVRRLGLVVGLLRDRCGGN